VVEHWGCRIAESLGVALDACSLSKSERQSARLLAEQKYRSAQWNRRR
jgi:hypothetical protein